MFIVVETFVNVGESSVSERRVRPVIGQPFSMNLRVECSKGMRYAHPLGQKFLLDVHSKQKEDGSPFLYSNYRAEWRPISDEDACKILSGR